MKKATRPEGQRSRAHGDHITSQNPADLLDLAPTKIARVLMYLRHFGPLNRFEAERLGDHCLPSTVAVLANRHGLAFQRQPEQVPNRWGKPCLVTRYSLPTSEHDKVRKVLALLSAPSKRAAA